jgi:hypothetical protein
MAIRVSLAFPRMVLVVATLAPKLAKSCNSFLTSMSGDPG